MVQVDPIYFLDVLPHITVYYMDLHGITVCYVYCIEFRYICSNPAQTQCHCWLAESLQNECTWTSFDGLSEDVWNIAGNNHSDSVWVMLIHCLETMLFCGSFIGSFFHEIFCQPKSCALIFKFHMNWRQVQNVINFDERILENFGRHKRCWLCWCRIAGWVFGLFLGDELVLDLCFFWGSPGKMDYLS